MCQKANRLVLPKFHLNVIHVTQEDIKAFSLIIQNESFIIAVFKTNGTIVYYCRTNGVLI